MNAGAGPAGHDTGLQPQRTQLAWRRHVLAHAVVVLLLVRLALTRGATGALVAAAALGCWALVVAVSYRRMVGPREAGRPDGPGPVTTRTGGPALPASGAVTVAYAVLAAVLLLVG